MMFCENCGKNLPNEAKFCNGCGTKIATAQPMNAEAERPAVNTAAPPINKPPVQAAPPPPPQQTYAPPGPYMSPQTYIPPVSYSPQQGSEPLRVIQYIGMFLLMSIPLVGIILLFVWGFGSGVNPNKKNFARAMLILSLIGLVLSFIFGAVIIGIIGELIGGMGGYY